MLLPAEICNGAIRRCCRHVDREPNSLQHSHLFVNSIQLAHFPESVKSDLSVNKRQLPVFVNTLHSSASMGFSCKSTFAG
ncbi:hypothetical protein C0J52_00642 [Blattella germanica]|nr:hypothetical protein C0J52_00642 [Blattella germanica]